MKNEAKMVFMCKWVYNFKQSMVLRFKRVKNKAKMVVILKGVKIEVINGFKI